MCVEGVALWTCADPRFCLFHPLACGFWLLLVHPVPWYGIDVCIRGAWNRRQLRAQQVRSTGRSLRLCSRRPPWACCISHGAVSRKVRLSYRYRSCSSFPSICHSPILPFSSRLHTVLHATSPPGPKPGFPLPPCRGSLSYCIPSSSSTFALLLLHCCSPRCPCPPLVEVFHPRVATARACCCCGLHRRSLTCLRSFSRVVGGRGVLSSVTRRVIAREPRTPPRSRGEASYTHARPRTPLLLLLTPSHASRFTSPSRLFCALFAVRRSPFAV